MNLTKLQITNCFNQKFSFFYLTILHITNNVIFEQNIQTYKITHYFRHCFWSDFLFNLTRLHITNCFFQFWFFFFDLTILHISVKDFRKSIFQHYKITHYFKLLSSKFSFWTLLNYRLQTVLIKNFPFSTLQYYKLH